MNPTVISALGNSHFLPLLVAAALWPLLCSFSHFLLLKVLDAQRAAEIPRVVRVPSTVAIFLGVLLFADQMVSDALGPAYYQDQLRHSIHFLLLSGVRIGLGTFVFLTFRRMIRLFRTEHLDRLYSGWGADRERNTVTLTAFLAEPVLFLLCTTLVFWLSGLNVAGYLVAFGGVGVAIALAMQALLTNIFAGMSLALDAPFGINDLIRLGQAGETYQVLKRGLRVTSAKNISTHETVYLPNKLLTEVALVDVTRPTDDLRAIIDVGMPYSADLRQVREILIDIANGHPHVVGAFAAKQKAIKDKIYRLYLRRVFKECREHFIELARLQCEADLNSSVLDLKQRLESWAAFVDKYEQRGFDEREKRWLKAISQELSFYRIKIESLTTQWQILLRNCTAGAKVLRFRGLSHLDSELGWMPKFEDVNKIVEQLKLPTWWNQSQEDSGSTASEGQEPASEISLGEYIAQGEKEWEEYERARMSTPRTDLKEHTGTLVGEKLVWLASALRKLALQPQTNIGEANCTKEESFSYHRNPALLDKSFYLALPELFFNGDKFVPDESVEVGGDIFFFSPDFDLSDADSPSSSDTSGSKTLGWKFRRLNQVAACFYIHHAIAAANLISDAVKVAPLTVETSEQYAKAQKDAKAEKNIHGLYNALGDAYGQLMREFTRWIVTESTEPFDKVWNRQGPLREIPFSIYECRTRTEDQFISRDAVLKILDHPLSEAIAGSLTDDDERDDLSKIITVWGDKINSFRSKAQRITRLLEEARSTVIDTELRALAIWLKEEFKDPFPAWKYPIAPVEGFGESSIQVTMKVYIDNVRMEKYLRPANAFTQFRLRIKERLENAGITIPFPQRVLTFGTPLNVAGNFPNGGDKGQGGKDQEDRSGQP